jgi:cyclase
MVLRARSARLSRRTFQVIGVYAREVDLTKRGGLSMERVRGNIYVETDFVGCNPGFVVTSKGIVMIDTPQKPTDALEWKKEIQKRGEVIYIINTDHHQDHALGNFFYDGDIVTHEGTMGQLLSEERLQVCRDWVKIMEPQSVHLMAHYFVKKPTITYSERMEIHAGDETFELIHITGHTSDETIVYMPERNILFSGDNVCTNGIPTLYESYPKEWLEAIELIEGLDFEVLVPGHGQVGDKGSVKQFEEELSSFFKIVQERIDKGVSKERIIEEVRYDDTVHLDYPPTASETFERFMKKSVERLYNVFTCCE